MLQRRAPERNLPFPHVFPYVDRFDPAVTDWSGLEEIRNNTWQKQLHIFEVPFYYIEYAIAQLGAIAVWKNYKENPEKGLANYIAALKFGYTKNIKKFIKQQALNLILAQSTLKN